MTALATSAALVIDTDRVIATVHGRPVTLTRRQFELLAMLASDPERCFTHSVLAREIWGDTHDRARTLKSHASTLRSALGGVFVVSVYSVGYRLVQPGDAHLVDVVIGSTG